MTFLLDTNAISDLMRANSPTVRWLAALEDPDRILTCPIVWGEILFGISRLSEGKRKTELQEASNKLRALFYSEPVPAQAGIAYAAVKLLRQRNGLPLDENDLWIAATAIALKATLVTRDSDFLGIPDLAIVTP